MTASIRLEAFERGECSDRRKNGAFWRLSYLQGQGIQRIGPCVVMLGGNPRTTTKGDDHRTARVMKSFSVQLAYSEVLTAWAMVHGHSYPTIHGRMRDKPDPDQSWGMTWANGGFSRDTPRV
jgi:hypothetical protein